MFKRMKSTFFSNTDSAFHDMASDGIGKLKSNMQGQMKIANQADSDLAILNIKDSNARQKKIMERTKALEEANSKLAEKGTDNAIKQMTENSSRINQIRGYGSLDDAGRTAKITELEAARTAADKQAWKEAKSAPKKAWDYAIAADREGDPDRFKVGAIRTGAIAAAYGGVAVGTRYANGGGVTYNNQGQRDIAGIPFL